MTGMKKAAAHRVSRPPHISYVFDADREGRCLISVYAACAAFSAFAAAMASMSSLSDSVLSAASLATAANRSACTLEAVSGSHVLRPLGGVVLILNFTMSCTLSFPQMGTRGTLPRCITSVS